MKKLVLVLTICGGISLPVIAKYVESSHTQQVSTISYEAYLVSITHNGRLVKEYVSAYKNGGIRQLANKWYFPDGSMMYSDDGTVLIIKPIEYHDWMTIYY